MIESFDVVQNILRSVLLLVAAFYVGGWLRRAVHRVRDEHVDPSWKWILGGFVRWLPAALLLPGALELVGIPGTSVLAALSTAGLAIALSLKDQLSNAASGALILTTHPFRVGDLVTIGTLPTVTGSVHRIGFLTVEIDTDDGRRVTLTHDKVLAAPMERHAHEGRTRVEVLATVPRALLRDPQLAELGEIVPLEIGVEVARIAVRRWVGKEAAADARIEILSGLDARIGKPAGPR